MANDAQPIAPATVQKVNAFCTRLSSNVGRTMSWLPQDWVSPAWVAVVAGAGILARDFFKKVSEDLYAWLKRKVHPAPPEPVRVKTRFEPTLYATGDCLWVAEEKLYKYEDENYTHYPHAKTGGHVYRISSPGPPPRKEFLLAKPNAKKVAAVSRTNFR